MQRTMMRAGALLDAGQLQFFNRVGDLLQVMLGEMQIPGRDLQILVTEQKLNGAQVGSGFKQMCRPAVANQVRSNPLADTRPFCRFGADTPHDLIGDRLFAVAMQA